MPVGSAPAVFPETTTFRRGEWNVRTWRTRAFLGKPAPSQDGCPADRNHSMGTQSSVLLRAKPSRKSQPWRALAFGVALVSAAAARLPGASSFPGLLGMVYGDPACTRPIGSCTLRQLDHEQVEWPDANDWGLRLHGSLTAPVSGRVRLRIETGQHARLWLRGEKIIDVSSGEGVADVSMTAGKPVPLIFEFAQESAPSRLRVFWQLPGRPPEPVPRSALTHDPADREAIAAAGVKPYREMLLEVVNPDPRHLPSLRVWRREEELLVGATFPEIPDFTCDSWCYEGDMEFLGCRDVRDGRLELRHRLTAAPDVLVVTTVTPEPGAVEFKARLERADGRAGPLPDSPAVPNLCWQLRNAAGFASRPEPYPEFVARCFIFTERGRTFLHETVRRPIPARSADDPRNNPPWVQLYGPIWEPPQRSGANAWADFSTDRFTCTIVGAVSRDRRFLAAIASGSAGALCQAWHDCMHIISAWSQPEESGPRREWRLKIYVMENDPERLLQRAVQDFPAMRRQPAFATGPGAASGPR